MVRHKETSCHQAYILRVCILAWVRIGGPWRAHITWLSFGAPNITLRLIFGSLLKSSKDPRTKSMKPRSDIHRVTSKSCFSGQRTFSHFIDNKALIGALPVPNGNNWKPLGANQTKWGVDCLECPERSVRPGLNWNGINVATIGTNYCSSLIIWGENTRRILPIIAILPLLFFFVFSSLDSCVSRSRWREARPNRAWESGLDARIHWSATHS